MKGLTECLIRSIAWSKSGTIASISPDSCSVQVSFLRADPSDGCWGLSQPSTFDRLTATPSNPIVHLAWSEASPPQLAVIDSIGQVAILTFSETLNDPTISRRWDGEYLPAGNNEVVGCVWLQPPPALKESQPDGRTDPFHTQYGPAVKKGDSYQCQKNIIPDFGPWLPARIQSAFICFTAGGRLRVNWDEGFGSWRQTMAREILSYSTARDTIYRSLYKDCGEKLSSLMYARARVFSGS